MFCVRDLIRIISGKEKKVLAYVSSLCAGKN